MTLSNNTVHLSQFSNKHDTKNLSSRSVRLLASKNLFNIQLDFVVWSFTQLLMFQISRPVRKWRMLFAVTC